MKALRSQSVVNHILAMCLGVLASASNANAEGIELLAKENVGLSDIHAYVESATDSQAQAELIGALETDPRFAKGTPGYGAAIQALASLRDKDGWPLADNPRQSELWLDAAVDKQLGSNARTLAIWRLNGMSALKPDAVRETYRQLLDDSSPFIVSTTARAIRSWEGLDTEFSPALLALATNPAEVNPEAALKARQRDEEQEAQFPGYSQESGFTVEGSLRAEAASAWAMSESPQRVIDHLSGLNLDEDSRVWAVALQVTLIDPESPLRSADDKIKRKVLDLWATAMSKPECVRFASSTATGAMLYFIADNPGLTNDVLDALEVIAAGHPNDQRLQETVLLMKERYE